MIPNDETVAEEPFSLPKKELNHEGDFTINNKIIRITPGIMIRRRNIFTFLDSFIKLRCDFISELQ
jgi:hypothetical protein